MIYLTQSIHRNAQIYPNQLVTVYKHRERTWAQFKERIGRAAAGLVDLGVQSDDRVAILALNSDYYLEYYSLVPWAGACVVPLNIRWSVKENAYSLNDAGARVLFVDDTFSPMVAALRAEGVQLDHVIYIGEKECPSDMVSYEAMIDDHEPIADTYRHDQDLAGIYYTGGTTGFPKGVMLTHTSVWTSAISLIVAMAISNNAKYLHAAPMFHLADGAMNQANMIAGACHYFVPAFNPAEVSETISKYRITHSLLVPIMIQMTVEHVVQHPTDMNSLEFLLYGASPISEAVLIKAMKTFPNTKFSQGYGQTELSPLATMLGPEYHTTEGPNAGKLTSAGRPIACVEIKIVDEQNQTLGIRAIGEVAVKGPNAMIGYWNKPEETAKSMKEGWIHTGDAGYMDEEGFLFLVDRVKDMIVSGGENVYSTEVENAIMKHDAVAQTVVIGIPHEKWGEQVHAEVILKEGATATDEEIKEHCAEYIANYKCPRSVTFRTEPFPISGAGKLLKRTVREKYWEGKDRMVS
jgi:acyl-CoA synthetase (AMP-forming)/AMP-acid ligase II